MTPMSDLAKIGVGTTILFVFLWQFRTVLEMMVGISVNTIYYVATITLLTIVVGAVWYLMDTRVDTRNVPA